MLCYKGHVNLELKARGCASNDLLIHRTEKSWAERAISQQTLNHATVNSNTSDFPFDDIVFLQLQIIQLERSLEHFYFIFLLTCTTNTTDKTENTLNAFSVQTVRGCEQTAYASETRAGIKAGLGRSNTGG